MKQLVLVTWDDAEDQDATKTWMDEEDINTFSQQNCTVASVGYLVSKTSKYVTLAADWIDKLGHYGRITKIPTGMVVKIEDLSVSPS